MAEKQDLKAQIISFLQDYSIEATAHDADKLGEFPDLFQPGTAIYVAHLPGLPIDDVVDFAGRLRALGFRPVPHIVARKLESREQLASSLARLEQLGVADALVIAGDQAIDNAAFDSTLEVLETGLFEKYGFREVGVAGHPEGSKAIGEQRVREALMAKTRFAATAPYRMHITTQFGFDPVAVTDWESATSTEGVDLPIHVGMAGPASLRQLVRFAMKCGIGSSARMLMTRTGATANLLRTQAPDELITHFARHRADNSSSRLSKAHFFAFGGVTKTARWVNAVLAGRLEMNSQGTGFQVES
jgi:methylenetetrahydrofolate reductase (NADPH)